MGQLKPPREAMPTLIRLVIILAVLAGLAYAAMFGLVAVVEPNEKEVTIRIPARDLVPSVDRAPVVRREIDTSRPIPSPAGASDPAGEPSEPEPAEGEASGADEDGIVTLSPGTE